MENAGKRYVWWLALPCVAALGCDDVTPPAREVSAAPVSAVSSAFELATAGTLRGSVTWQGAVPVTQPFQTRPHPLAGLGVRERQVRANPNAPQIDAASRGVANAVVYLRGVDPRRSRPWDLPSVRLEMRDRRVAIRQGEQETRVGVVRRGDAVTMVSNDQYFHSLHADGAAFFSLMFPKPDRPLERRLNKNGLVEWSSGCGYYWLRGYTFVDELPYYALTDHQGRFTLTQVPPGRYDAVCWLPNWQEERHDRDPDMAIIWRIAFRRPLERIKSVRIEERVRTTVDFVMSPE